MESAHPSKSIDITGGRGDVEEDVGLKENMNFVVLPIQLQVSLTVSSPLIENLYYWPQLSPR